ncbi:DUF2793 domain-containing protein [Altererythrobacter aerius]|uniref:DUF2793 domain-containing protein n=1 Tax=Tsuneonella aeria TaxID=1837929 RepID=A0A6I4TDE4_9SPHN|nr:DUF2793 domain-containing protein [Tsuneonella aeria]
MPPASPKACAAPSTATPPGQAQKEVSVNAALARADILLHPAIEGESAAPPASPRDGECWPVAADGTGAFAGHAGELASFTLGQWHFTPPFPGLRVHDRAAGQAIVFLDSWQRVPQPALPAGGAVVDAEARAAIAELVRALCNTAIFPAQGPGTNP